MLVGFLLMILAALPLTSASACTCAQPSRLDLNDHHARRAKVLGVMISINTDTHFLDQLDNMALGVATARRAWITKADVINTMPLGKLLTWAHRSRPRPAK